MVSSGNVFILHCNCVYVTQELCLYYTGIMLKLHRKCVYATQEVCLYYTGTMLKLHRNCVYATETVFVLHRYCVNIFIDKITRDLVVPANFIFGTDIRNLCYHIQCCFSLRLIHLTDQGFNNQCPDSKECYFCCNLMGSSMARLGYFN
jgi:hypothetical protein